ncbi:hypothetical protein QOT17_025437 [Balamuthia mandrillaris]
MSGCVCGRVCVSGSVCLANDENKNLTVKKIKVANHHPWGIAVPELWFVGGKGRAARGRLLKQTEGECDSSIEPNIMNKLNNTKGKQRLFVHSLVVVVMDLQLEV